MLVARLLGAACLALLVSLLAAVPVSAPAASQRSVGNAAERPEVLIVGDSLAVGMEPYLGSMLPGRVVTWDAVKGRTTPQGLKALRLRLSERLPLAVGISLGTNDGSDPRRFASRIRRALAAIPRGTCVVWANVNRPPRKGAFAALNRVLRAQVLRDARMRLVDWDLAVSSRTVRLPDHVHPDAAGFRSRSRMYARAFASCERAR